MRTRDLRLGCLLAAAGTLSLAACAGPEPAAVVYVSAGPEVAEWLEDAFRASHPDQRIEVEVLAGPAALERLRAEAASPVADAWLGAPSWLLARAAAKGLLDGDAPPWAPVVPTQMRDAQGRWTGWTVDPMVIALNSDRTSRGRAPRDWIDLFHPRWTGDVLLPDPRGSEAMEAFIGTKVAGARVADGRVDGDDTPGFDWLARLDAARKGYVTDPRELVRRLWSGEVSLALLPLSSVQAAKDEGRPVDYRIPESPSPTLVRGVAEVAGGPHAGGGAALVAWLGQPEVRAEVARRFAWMPAVTGVAAGEPAWLTEGRSLVRMDVVSADTLAAHMDGWLARWRDEVMGRTVLLP